MDMSQMQDQVTQWIDAQFQGKQTIGRDELVQKAQGSNLPTQAKEQIQQLPQGQWQKQDLIDTVKSKIGSQMGGMGGMGGGMGGRLGGA